MKTDVFAYVKSINHKNYIDHTRDYNPFLTNNAMSYTLDTIMICNELNYYHSLPTCAQYDFLYHAIRKSNRYSPWFKEEGHPHLDVVMQYYGYSKQKALEALKVLSQDQIKAIIDTLDTGGS